MTLLVIRDTPRCAFVLIVNGERVGEFVTEAAAREFAELQFGVVAGMESGDRNEA